jgi:hypothetical protein
MRDEMSWARRACALVQHHDGITGTARHEVVADYSLKLDKSREIARDVITLSTRLLLQVSFRFLKRVASC